jgi:hypothetical protein
MQKFIVGNISQDINSLKEKMVRESGMAIGKPEQPRGSEGQDARVASMLDYFDEVNEKIDFGEICKSINGLKDKIVNDSQ